MYADHLLENIPTTLEGLKAEVERLRIENGSLRRLGKLIRNSAALGNMDNIRGYLRSFASCLAPGPEDRDVYPPIA